MHNHNPYYITLALTRILPCVEASSNSFLVYPSMANHKSKHLVYPNLNPNPDPNPDPNSTLESVHLILYPDPDPDLGLAPGLDLDPDPGLDPDPDSRL